MYSHFLHNFTSYFSSLQIVIRLQLLTLMKKEKKNAIYENVVGDVLKQRKCGK